MERIVTSTITMIELILKPNPAFACIFRGFDDPTLDRLFRLLDPIFPVIRFELRIDTRKFQESDSYRSPRRVLPWYLEERGS